MLEGALEPNKTFSVDFLVQVGLNQHSLLSPLLGEGNLIFLLYRQLGELFWVGQSTKY